MDALLHSLVFYVLAFIVLASAAYTAFSPHLVRAAFSLLFTFFALAGLYIYLGADFVGISQVIIYVGGILVLLLFGVMFTVNLSGAGTEKQTLQVKWGILFLILLLVLLLPIAFTTPWQVMPNPETKSIESTVSPVGVGLLTKYLLPFEIASLLLLIALIGAVIIARGEPKVRQESTEEETPPAA